MRLRRAGARGRGVGCALIAALCAQHILRTAIVGCDQRLTVAPVQLTGKHAQQLIRAEILMKRLAATEALHLIAAPGAQHDGADDDLRVGQLIHGLTQHGL